MIKQCEETHAAFLFYEAVNLLSEAPKKDPDKAGIFSRRIWKILLTIF